MLRLVNKTPFATALMPALNKEGVDHAVVVVKGTFPIVTDSSGEVEQRPVAWPDAHYGAPDKSSVKYAGDAALRKPGTDVYLVACAHAPRSGVAVFDASIEVGSTVRKTVRVIGDRVWYRVLGSWKATEPRPVERVPVLYERAFGGWTPTGGGAPGSDFEPRNPVGVGYGGPNPPKSLEGKPLPNIEDPRQPLGSPWDRPEPAGLGAIAPWWAQRYRWAGTLDEAWQAERCPLLPLDFDERYFQVAPPDLVTPKHLTGGEPVRLTNLDPKGSEVFTLPRRQVRITARIRGSESVHDAALDTVCIEPEENRVVLAWRATIPCPGEFLLIDVLKVEEAN